MINIGAYAEGSNPAIDLAIQKIGPFNQFLRQEIHATAPLTESLESLKTVVGGAA